MREKKKEEIKNLDDLRAERCYDAAENGSDGSTHREIIQDWRDYLGTLKVIDPEFPEETGDITEEICNTIISEIDACEAWHIEHGSIDEQLS